MKTFQLSHNSVELSVVSFGAEVQSLRVNGKKILWEKETEHWNRVAPILFPFVGKLKNNEYYIEEQRFPMTQHGFARDMEFNLIEQSQNSLHFQLCENNLTLAKFPYPFVLNVRYRIIDGGLECDFEVCNTSENILPCSLGAHPALALDETIENYYLEFEDTKKIEISLLQDGLFSEEKKKLSLNYGKLMLTDTLFENDALVIHQPTFNTVKLVNVNSGHIVSFITEYCTAFGIWTKKGAPFICLEPWMGWADEANHDGELIIKPGMEFLRPNESLKLKFQLSL